MTVANRNIVINELKTAGINNKYSIAAILAVIDKESGFKPQSEKSYSNTSNARIQDIFEKTKTLSDAELTNLKKDPVKFFNFVYGGRFGNTASEGYLYRGRGFNQLTFKDNYKRYSNLLKIDLVNNPDLVNDPKIAAKIVSLYFIDRFKNNADIVLKRYKAKNINDFNDSKTAVNAFYNANAGFGKDTSKLVTPGKTKALSKVDSFLKIVTTGAKITLPLLIIGGLLFYYLNK
jgi:predicted chitinase